MLFTTVQINKIEEKLTIHGTNNKKETKDFRQCVCLILEENIYHFVDYLLQRLLVYKSLECTLL